MTSQKHKQLKVFYDGLCPLCSREIDHYRTKQKSDRIEFVDIARPEFNAEREGLDPKHVLQRFHVKTQNGDIKEGVDAFVEIWKVLNIWTPMQKLACHWASRPLFDLGYSLFAKVRPVFRKQDCDSGYCDIEKKRIL